LAERADRSRRERRLVAGEEGGGASLRYGTVDGKNFGGNVGDRIYDVLLQADTQNMAPAIDDSDDGILTARRASGAGQQGFDFGLGDEIFRGVADGNRNRRGS
jgi:hypothetical protein